MLVLTRKIRETIKIGDHVTITLLKVKGQTVRIGIEAPRDVRVIRGELPEHVTIETEESPAEEPVESARQIAVPSNVRATQVIDFRFRPEGAGPLSSRVARKRASISNPPTLSDGVVATSALGLTGSIVGS